MFKQAREFYLESSSLLLLVVKWRKPLVIIILSTLVVSIIFSSPFFIKPKFRSSVIFFPSSTNSVSKILLEENSDIKQDIMAFGEEEEAEQMLQILNSDEIRENIIAKYDLMNHYGIEPEGSYPKTKLFEEFVDNVTFSRTKFMSVRIDVLDTDPQMAADMANDIAAYVDSIKTKIQRKRAEDALVILGNSYQTRMAEIKAKEDSLRKLRERGVMDFRVQTEIVNKEYTLLSSVLANESARLELLEKNNTSDADTAMIGARSRVMGAQVRMKNLQKQLDNLAELGGASISLNQELNLEREELLKIKNQYDKLAIDASQNLTPKFVVNKAVKAEKKSYPVRWLIVVVSVTISFLLSLVVLLTIDRVKEIKQQL